MVHFDDHMDAKYKPDCDASLSFEVILSVPSWWQISWGNICVSRVRIPIQNCLASRQHLKSSNADLHMLYLWIFHGAPVSMKWRRVSRRRITCLDWVNCKDPLWKHRDLSSSAWASICWLQLKRHRMVVSHEAVIWGDPKIESSNLSALLVPL